MRPDEPIRIIIIGAGRMAAEHVRTFQHVSDVEIVGVTSRSGTSAERLAADFAIPRAGIAWQPIAESEAAHACVIATAHSATAQIAGDAIDAGLHVLAEKPVSLSPGSIRTLAADAEAAGVVAMAAMNRRFFRSVLAAIDIVRLHGPVLGVTLQAPDPVTPKRAWGGYSSEVFDNWTAANTLHAIDLLRLVAGEATLVGGVAREASGERSTVAILQFDSGALGTYTSHGATGGTWRMEIHGDGVEADLSPLETGTIRVGGREERLPYDDAGLKYGTHGQAEAFAAAVRTGHIDRPASDLEDHARSLELALEIAEIPVR